MQYKLPDGTRWQLQGKGGTGHNTGCEVYLGATYLTREAGHKFLLLQLLDIT